MEEFTARVDSTEWLSTGILEKYQTPRRLTDEPDELQNVRLHQLFIETSGAAYIDIIDHMEKTHGASE